MANPFLTTLRNALLLCPLLCYHLTAGEEVINDSQGMPCYVYTPDPLDADTTYQLVVEVHGAGGQGKGAAGLKGWASRGDVIVIGPSFQTKGKSSYQMGNGVHAEKLLKLFDDLGGKCKLREKMFLYGFSGGSQFTHRFVMLHPKMVCGVAAHSGGSWATDNYRTFNSKLRDIPFAISCGEKDTKKAWGEAPWNRLDWFNRFREQVEKSKFCHIAKTWPEQGHRAGPGVHEITRQCFQLATGLPGESAKKTVKISPDWQNLDNLPEPPVPESANSVNRPYVDSEKLSKAAKAAFAIADTETVTDEKLVVFMEKYPPVLWMKMEGAENLLKQCQAAAERWKKKATELGRFNGRIEQRFLKFSNGLETP